MASQSFFCVYGHTCGNPVRLGAGGAPLLHGKSMSEKRLYFMEHFDHIRRGLMFEPRGHDMMSGSMLYPPHHPDHDVAVLFIETSGCLPMCGHGTIGTITMAIEEGLLKPKTPGTVLMEAPAGLITIHYQMDGNKVKSVKLTNVASYLEAEDLPVKSEALGSLKVDVAYGGNFYAIIDPQPNFPGLEHFRAEALIAMSRHIRQYLNAHYTFVHPEDSSIQGLSHVLWTGTPLHAGSTARNAVFYGDKAIDRSPCGTGTSARMAQWHAKGKLKPGDSFIHESFIGSTFLGRVERSTEVAGKKAIIPSIEGWAIKTGYNTLFLDDNDPYVHGFQVI